LKKWLLPLFTVEPGSFSKKIPGGRPGILYQEACLNTAAFSFVSNSDPSGQTS
jgi:hypothetical protein